MTYNVKFDLIGHSYYATWSSNDNMRGGTATSYLIRIMKDDKMFIDTGVYIERLNPRNNKFQDEYIRQRYKDWRMVIDHDTELNEKDHVYGKALTLLKALRMYDKLGSSE